MTHAVQHTVLTIGVAVALAVAVHLAGGGWRPPALWLTGVMLGVALYRGAFGFTAAYRRWFVDRDASGVLAQLALVALTGSLFAAIFWWRQVDGDAIAGAWAPVAVSVAAGALLFGVGMQLAGGCGSGTLYTAGGGSVRMTIVLVFACAGSYLASLQMHWWQALPSRDPIVLGELMGWPAAAAVQLAIIGAAVWLVRRHASRATADGRVGAAVDSSRGRWPAAATVMVLASGNALTLWIAGHPWSIMWGLTLWGAKGASLAGHDAAAHPFWQAPFQADALAGGLLDDTTSMMDLALMNGALCAAAAAGRFRPSWQLGWRPTLAAVLGGLAIGYGARIAYGCNIGAFVSGVASGSLHGWLWIAAALPGNWIGVRLRPMFGLSER